MRHAFLSGSFVVLLLTVWPRPAVAVPQSGLTPQQIQDAASRVMENSDFNGVRRRVLENLPADQMSDDGFLLESLRSAGASVSDFFEWLFRGLFTSRPRRVRPAPTPAAPPSSTSSGGGMEFNFGSIMLYMGLAALILVTIWIIATLVRRADPGRRLNRDGLFGDDLDGVTDLAVPPGELAASTYESRAIQMAGDGNYRLAVRELLIGGMSWIERAGLIRFRRGLTNRDYVRAVWRQPERRDAYQQTAREFERIYFGRRDATRDSFENCLRLFQESFREDEKTTAEV
ncbi:MAG: DUF4129 domain-containing protein [Planctomycetaceae bacterium]|nr:DUF4129 domain-containing protein [Planctomycetaceae bacterium]